MEMNHPEGVPQHPESETVFSRRSEATPGAFGSFVGTKEQTYLKRKSRTIKSRCENKEFSCSLV
jgi:hypothetical protein